ncbi:MAG: HTTM domain-containing protein [Pirellulaceae bacterium]|nr:HTTM domain-containing protein [Pirellulaceae bacterium]
MNPLASAAKNWFAAVVRGWDRFWFTPAQPHTLALLRILGGGMILYTHLVWSINLEAFLGPQGWLPRGATAVLNQTAEGNIYAWSYLAWVDSPALVWPLHIAALIVLAMLVAGFWTRATSILAFVITLSYCHRLPMAMFGLDQINALLAMYLMVGRSGDVWSVDRWLATRKHAAPPIAPSIGTNIAIRLIQLHMCIIYLFGGIGKMKGVTWWDGTATWYSFSNLEYQSLDMLWTVHYPAVLSLLTHITVFWETFYCFLVWNKITRPICLALAVAVHGGIALFLGMKTFGLVMIIANMAFLSPEFVHATVALLCRPFAKLLARRDAVPLGPPRAAFLTNPSSTSRR